MSKDILPRNPLRDGVCSSSAFDAQMWIAWCFLAFIAFGYVVLRIMHSPSLETQITLAGVALGNPWILIYLIRALRGGNRKCSDLADDAPRLSAWGYFWRSYIVFLSSIPVLAVISEFVPIPKVIEATGIELVGWEILFVVSAIFCTWLLFSRDRTGQVKILLSAVQRY